MLIQTYQSGWVADFEQLKSALHKAVGAVATGIEHVGSTAVPQLAAKPIIDIDMTYEAPETFGRIKARLEKTGYRHGGDQGIPGREVFKRNLLKEPVPILDTISHHLYVCQLGSGELERHLAFRDFLRNHEKERQEYERLKYEIAAQANQDRKAYARLKEVLARDFIEAILKNILKDRWHD
ncbi:MAG: GrpB family protein [Phaeodactylibacter sp.]|nr:GrpB family protein [Phaeodactylibacter sp.]